MTIHQFFFTMVTLGIGIGTLFSYLFNQLVMETTLVFNLACLGLGLVMGLLNYCLIRKLFFKPIKEIAVIAEEISKGNFDIPFKQLRSDNSVFSPLYNSISAMSGCLQRMEHRVNVDALTGLPNRTFFNDSLNLALVHAQGHQRRLAVLFLDLDGFKMVNDKLGHEVGDLLLKGVAHRLAACINKGDSIARLGGDEFTILLPRIDRLDEAALTAKKVLASLQHPWLINGHKLQLSASIGIAAYPEDGESSATLLKQADAAMYEAKKQGKNNYQFYRYSVDNKAFQPMKLQNGVS